MQRINARDETRSQPLTIRVATSGDTGSAVASAFHRRAGINILILYPHGQVSARQEHQLCCWDTNVRALSVDGAFDDCQRLVKEAFADEPLRTQHRLSSANSINIGRLLPQAAYYAASSLWHWRANGERANYIVPTGNLGNAMACIWARQMGLPIGQVLLATNANRPIPDYLNSGDWQPRASLSTLASAMDVGNPSNMERLRDLFPAFDELSQAVSAVSVDDAQIEEQIRQDAGRLGQIWCPHTATAMHAYDHALSQAQRDGGHWIAVATAHPAKFEAIVEPLVGHTVDVPPALAALLMRPTQVDRIDARLSELRRCLDAGYPASQPS